MAELTDLLTRFKHKLEKARSDTVKMGEGLDRKAYLAATASGFPGSRSDAS
jgi:hypothetical protein